MFTNSFVSRHILIVLAVLAEVSKNFQVDKAVANLCSSLDFVGVASTALYWSQTAQSSGRKTILVVGLSLVVIFTALAASASSVGMLITMRVLSSASATGIIITGVAAVNDMWEIREKGFAMGIYFLGPLASPAVGPVIGGALGNQWGWRAILRFIAAMAGVLLLCVILLLPETKRGTALPSQHRGQPFQSNFLGSRPFLQHFYRPLLFLAYLRYPFVFILLSTAAFSYTLTTIFFMTLQSTFSAPPQNFDPLTLGLLYLPYALGTFFASILGGQLSDHAVRRHAPVSGALYPENRVRSNALAACALQLLALPSLGWALRYQAPWYATVVPAALLGMSCGLNLGIATTVLVELVPAQAAGLVAMNSVGRNLAGAIGGSVAQPAMSAIGAGWLYIALFVVAIVNLGGIITVRVLGGRWREKMWRNEGIVEERRGAGIANAEAEAEAEAEVQA